MLTHLWEKNNYCISTDKLRLDVGIIHSFLTKSYWATGRTLPQVKASIENSVCFGVYKADIQIGFARVITDFITCGYLADVFIVPQQQGEGLGKWLVETILNTPELKNLSFWLLLTQDAQWLYKRCGFHRFDCPDGVMVKRGPG